MQSSWVVHSGVRGWFETTRGTWTMPLYAAYSHGPRAYTAAHRAERQWGLRENSSSRSSGVSRAMCSTHSAEKKSPVGAHTTGTTACVMVSS